MAATTQNLIIKGFQIFNNGNISKGIKPKIEMITSHYGSIGAFLKANQADLERIVFKVDDKKFKLTKRDFAKIQSFQKSGLIDNKLSIQDNFVKILTTDFIKRQVKMIDNLNLDTLNVNPILAGALNLNNETDLIRYYTYQAISRSIVTSVGFLVQDLLLYASDFVFDGKEEAQGGDTKWDLVVKKVNEANTYLEIKSGPNDLNKKQIGAYKKDIVAIEQQGLKAFIGETYGKREAKTVTHGHYAKYLPDWENRTLIGKELWEYVSGTKDYHTKLIRLLYETSEKALRHETFIKKIEKKIKPLTVDFRNQYKTYDAFLNSLW